MDLGELEYPPTSPPLRPSPPPPPAHKTPKIKDKTLHVAVLSDALHVAFPGDDSLRGTIVGVVAGGIADWELRGAAADRSPSVSLGI